MQCKLFVFDKPAQSWIERGRGLLRLNDMASTDDGTLQSRLGQSRSVQLILLKAECFFFFFKLGACCMHVLFM